MLNVHTRVGTPDFAELQNKPQSCAIAFCEQAPTGCLSDVILRLKLVAVVAPKLLTDIELQRLDLHGETILCSHPLLNQSSLPTAWHDWLLSANLKTGAVSFGAEFALMSLVHQAALVGMGIALLPHYLIKDNLARGELVQLLPNRYEPRSSYQLIYTEENLKNPFFSAFQQWLFSQAAER